MCSWVNKKNGEPAISFADFTPKKKSKGIVFYDDRMIELVDSPELARGAILFSPVKAERKVLPVGEEMMTPPTKKRGSKALKLQQIKVKTEVGDVVESIVSPVAMTTPSRLKRVKKELVVEAIQTLTLDFSSPQPNIIPKKTKPRAKKIKTEDIGLINALVMSEGSLTPDTVTAAISDNESGSVKVTKRMTRASGRKGGDVEKIK